MSFLGCTYGGSVGERVEMPVCFGWCILTHILSTTSHSFWPRLLLRVHRTSQDCVGHSFRSCRAETKCSSQIIHYSPPQLSKHVCADWKLLFERPTAAGTLTLCCVDCEWWGKLPGSPTLQHLIFVCVLARAWRGFKSTFDSPFSQRVLCYGERTEEEATHETMWRKI